MGKIGGLCLDYWKTGRKNDQPNGNYDMDGGEDGDCPNDCGEGKRINQAASERLKQW